MWLSPQNEFITSAVQFLLLAQAEKILLNFCRQIIFTSLLNFIIAIEVFYVGVSQAVPLATATRYNIIIIMQITNVSLELDHPHCTLVTKFWYTDSVIEVSAAIRVTDSYLKNHYLYLKQSQNILIASFHSKMKHCYYFKVVNNEIEMNNSIRKP